MTVIVPVYNVERYLDRCLTSIVNQTYQNLEIILVDDGSPDSCPQMCDEWAKRDNRIKVIHKENAGLGMARNTGIENATGEYICFFDSDDYVDLDTIKLAHSVCKKERADVAVFGFVIADSKGNPIARKVPKPVKNTYSGKEVQSSFLPDLIGTDPKTGKETNLCMSACACLFSMEMILRTNWRFVSERDIISEDLYSQLELYQHVNKVVILENALYYYCDNQSSLTHTYRADRFEKAKFFYEKCLQLCRDCGYGPEVERRCTAPFLGNTCASLKQEVVHHSKKGEAVKRIRQILSDELLQKVLHEKMKEKTRPLRKALYWTMRYKQYTLCYILLMAKNKSEEKLRSLG